MRGILLIGAAVALVAPWVPPGAPAVVHANGVAGSAAADTATLLIGTWTVTEVRSGTIPQDTLPTLVFETGRLAGFAGCNRFGATLAVGDGGALAIGPAAITRMACAAPQMEVEAAILRALQRIDAVAFDSNGQIALLAFGTVMMRAARAPQG